MDGASSGMQQLKLEPVRPPPPPPPLPAVPSHAAAADASGRAFSLSFLPPPRLQNHELRMEVEWGKTVHLQLLEGQAEVFGTSLDLRERVAIGGQKVAIFSWQGCTLQLEGEPDVM